MKLAQQLESDLTLRNVYTFNARAKRILDLEEILDGDEWVNTRRFTSTFDVRNNMLSDLYEEWENGQWLARGRETNTYGAQGNELTKLWELLKDEKWVQAGRITNTYDDRDNMLSEMAESWENGQWLKLWRMTNTYDPNSNQLTGLEEDRVNGQRVNTFLIVYTYDAIGNLRSVSQYSWEESAWTPSGIRAGDFGGFHVFDNVGNEYSYHGWHLSFKYRTIVTDVVAETEDVPARHSLAQNYPNPFNPTTTIEFALPQAGYVTLRIYNVVGEEMASLIEGDHAAGTFKTTWDASGLPSGVYFYRLTAGEYVKTKKAVLLR